jgi:hypothetical protein
MSPSTEHRENRELASEIKFVIPEPLAEQISLWASERLKPDPHSAPELGDGYHTTSLYFDTQQFDVFAKRGSYGRSKYRIRRYGANPVVFLERKLKTRELVSKRRAIVPLEQLQALETGTTEADWKARWFQQRLAVRRLKPVCQIGYRRSARVAATEFGPIRLTMDRELRALPISGLGFVDGTGMLLLDKEVILEMKYAVTMPLLFKLMLEEFALAPRAISKYRTAVGGLGLAKPAGGEPQAPQACPQTTLCPTS